MKNENQLHYKVIDYLKKYFDDALVIPGLGENQVTNDLRIRSKLKGYRAGQPDIIIENCHKEFKGLAIELKTPKGDGVLRDNQTLFLRDMEFSGYKTLVSNDYDEIIHEVEQFFKDVVFPCLRCPRVRNFKTKARLIEHIDLCHCRGGDEDFDD